MVGAAGFEPATCSTQNYRATRLRHTPLFAALDTWFAGHHQAEQNSIQTGHLAGVPEYRVDHLVARLDAKIPRRACNDFKHRPHRSAGGNEVVRHWFGIFCDPYDAAVAADEHQIDRDVGVVHPE